LSARGTGRGYSAATEVYAWFFMRVSGLALLFLAVFHLLYMHLVLGVDNINFMVIARRWDNPAWRLFDLLLLVFALTHGGNGARSVLDDVMPRGTARAFLKWALYVAVAVLILMGAQIIFTFENPEGAAAAAALGLVGRL
jgi:succinate dehydrogenase / fumarate reductase membrane anchor subunit